MRGATSTGRWVALGAAAWVVTAGAARAADDVTLSFAEPQAHVYRLDGSFVTPAPRPVAWAVLADYDGLDRFVSSMRRSHVRERTADHLLVEQVAQGHALFFTRTVHLLLDVREHPYEAIRFEDVSHADVTSYAGTWHLTEVPGGTRVDYSVTARLDCGALGFIARRGIRGTSRGLLREVAAEMERRNGTPVAAAGAGGAAATAIETQAIVR